MTPEEYSGIMKKLDTLQKSYDRMDKDNEDYSNDNQQILIKLGSVIDKLDQLIKLVSTLPRKTQEQIADILEPVSEEIEDLHQTIDKKKFVAIQLKKLPHKWYKFWQRR